MLDKIVQANLKEAIIIAPWWYSKTWFPRLRNMTTDIRRLPLRGCLVRDLANSETEIDVFHLKLVAFKITGNVHPDRRNRTFHNHQNRAYRNIPLL